MKQTILVTGCAGFIGSHLCDRLLHLGYSVIGLDNFDPFYDRKIKEQNISESIDNDNFKFYEVDLKQPYFYFPFQNEHIDCIVHLAAMAGVRTSITNPHSYIHNNIDGTLNVLDFMYDQGITKMVFGSSSSVYGNHNATPFEETALVKNPISPYAFTKSSCELLNHTYHHLYNQNIVNLRFFTVYGPRQRPDLAINKFVRLMLEGAPIPVYGNGNSLRDYTYIDDIIQGIEKSINYLNQNNQVFEIINLGNGHPVSILDLIKTLAETLKVNPEIIFLPKQSGDVDLTYANIDKAKTLIDYKPEVELKQGLESFYNWYLTPNKMKSLA